MKVILNQSMAGPDGVFPAGATVDLPNESALHLLDTHQATPVKAQPVERATLQPAETAAAPTKPALAAVPAKVDPGK